MDGFEHHRIRHSHGELARGRVHINGIESFWSFAKKKLARHYGVRRKDFPLYLKEIEFRFNLRGQDPYMALLKIVKWDQIGKINHPSSP